MDISLSMEVQFSTGLKNIHMEGTMSQILVNLGLSFDLMTKTGNF